MGLNSNVMCKETVEQYLSRCKSLSLNASMAIALLIFERYCETNRIDAPIIGELLNYLWQWPLIDGSDQFEEWEQSRPELVSFGLGDEASENLMVCLSSLNISESAFRRIVFSLVEILWGSFWGAAEDELSMSSLRTIIIACQPDDYPVLTPFKFSLFKDKYGWGNKITKEDRDFWHHYTKSLPG